MSSTGVSSSDISMEKGGLFEKDDKNQAEGKGSCCLNHLGASSVYSFPLRQLTAEWHKKEIRTDETNRRIDCRNKGSEIYELVMSGSGDLMSIMNA